MSTPTIHIDFNKENLTPVEKKVLTTLLPSLIMVWQKAEKQQGKAALLNDKVKLASKKNRTKQQKKDYFPAEPIVYPLTGPNGRYNITLSNPIIRRPLEGKKEEDCKSYTDFEYVVQGEQLAEGKTSDGADVRIKDIKTIITLKEDGNIREIKRLNSETEIVSKVEKKPENEAKESWKQNKKNESSHAKEMYPCFSGSPAFRTERKDNQPKSYTFLSKRPGVSLDKLIEQGLDFKQELAIAIATAKEYKRLHSLGKVHCDPKPSNIMCFLKEGEEPRISIIDHEFTKQKETQKEKASGSIRYIAPETLTAPVKQTQQSDMFSVGAMLFELFFRGKKTNAEEFNLSLHSKMPEQFLQNSYVLVKDTEQSAWQLIYVDKKPEQHSIPIDLVTGLNEALNNLPANKSPEDLSETDKEAVKKAISANRDNLLAANEDKEIIDILNQKRFPEGYAVNYLSVDTQKKILTETFDADDLFIIGAKPDETTNIDSVLKKMSNVDETKRTNNWDEVIDKLEAVRQPQLRKKFEELQKAINDSIGVIDKCIEGVKEEKAKLNNQQVQSDTTVSFEKLSKWEQNRLIGNTNKQLNMTNISIEQLSHEEKNRIQRRSEVQGYLQLAEKQQEKIDKLTDIKTVFQSKAQAIGIRINEDHTKSELRLTENEYTDFYNQATQLLNNKDYKAVLGNNRNQIVKFFNKLTRPISWPLGKAFGNELWREYGFFPPQSAKAVERSKQNFVAVRLTR